MIRAATRMSLTISEADFSDAVKDLARVYRWRAAHFRPAQVRNGRWVTPMEGSPGFPDWVFGRADSKPLFVELKTHTGRLTSEQNQWLCVLGIHGYAVMWRPDHWNSGEILSVLRDGVQP